MPINAALRLSMLAILSINYMHFSSQQPCRNFPKIIGGGFGDTTIQQIDVFEKGDALAFAGDTNDASIAHVSMKMPIVGITSIQFQQYYWAKVDLSKPGFSFAVVAFSSDGILLATHSRQSGTTDVNSYITVYESLSGKVISSRTYSDSYFSITSGARSLIISSSLYGQKPMVYVWVGKRNPGSEIGKHLFKFDPFKLDSSYLWSLEAGPTKERHSIVFGRLE